jgi:hypothetical protein
MRTNTAALVLSLLVPALGWSQQLLVFPVVTDELPGMHGSLWVTNVRFVVARQEDQDIVVRRAWVCLEQGGFTGSGGVSWTMDGSDRYGRVRVLSGGSLLPGAEDVGAVGLEVEGGEVIADAYITDVRYGDFEDHGGRWAFGQGQLVPAIREPLVGPSHIRWLGGCLNNPCSQDPPERWNYLRNNIGLVNPNPQPMTFVGTVIPFGRLVDDIPGGIAELRQDPPETFTKTVPAYGWLQFRWEANTEYSGGFFYTGPAANGFIVSLTPDSDLPYYAYASVVFTPDPGSGAPEFNDPMFVAAEPGFIAPLDWGQPGAQSIREDRAPAAEKGAVE